MPATKYEFTPNEGEFKGVRTFARQVRHLSATNHILAAAALGEEPSADAGDENGPETVRTKAEILDYLKSSFVHLGKAIDAIGEVAAAIGVPRAVRAVARACASNKVAILIPCQRVIRGTGELGGYKWGLRRKRAIIDHEHSHREAGVPVGSHKENDAGGLTLLQ